MWQIPGHSSWLLASGQSSSSCCVHLRSGSVDRWCLFVFSSFCVTPPSGCHLLVSCVLITGPGSTLFPKVFHSPNSAWCRVGRYGRKFYLLMSAGQLQAFTGLGCAPQSPGHCSHLQSEPADGNTFSVCVSFSLSLPPLSLCVYFTLIFKEINK